MAKIKAPDGARMWISFEFRYRQAQIPLEAYIFLEVYDVDRKEETSECYQIPYDDYKELTPHQVELAFTKKEAGEIRCKCYEKFLPWEKKIATKYMKLWEKKHGFKD